MTNVKVKALSVGQTVVSMQENGDKGNNMAKEFTSVKKARERLENGIMVRKYNGQKAMMEIAMVEMKGTEFKVYQCK